MERIKEAVELAKANRSRLEGAPRPAPRRQPPGATGEAGENGDLTAWGGRPVALDLEHLKAMRIIAEDVTDPRARGFEMLRTQVFRKMSEHRHQTLGMTSPTSGCGKTVCALNLAFSIAQLAERSVTLVDLDLRKPLMRGYLGLPPAPGIDGLLRGEAKIEDIAVFPETYEGRLRILPTVRANRHAAALMASSPMEDLVEKLRAQDPTGVILFDLPPVLVADDVISFLPQLDCLLLIVAAGQTTVAEIISAERLLQDADVMGIVLNKSEEGGEASYYY